MASSSGTKAGDNRAQRRPAPWPKRSARRMRTNVLDIGNGERVPSSLSIVEPILRVANQVEKDNPTVAYLCRQHARRKVLPYYAAQEELEKYIENKYSQEEEASKHKLASNDRDEILKYYLNFYEKNIKNGQATRKRKEMAKNIEIASVLYDVLKLIDPSSKDDEKVKTYSKDVEEKSEQYAPYNILPLHSVGSESEIMKLDEIKDAIGAVCNVVDLPMPEKHSKPIKDIFEWLSLAFGSAFQKGNVANQREHLIMLLANMVSRDKKLDSTVQHLMDKVFENYGSWCKYLNIPPMWTQGGLRHNKQQLQLLYIGLYLLIWGEASNLRFMPECLCYIFHNMADDMNGLFSDAQAVSGGIYIPKLHGKEAFLEKIVTPIYEVLKKEAKRHRDKKVSHSDWRNYDDLNEYFWSKECFQLQWPMNIEADFFVVSSDENLARKQGAAGKRRPKTNFVEARTFWHLYRSFDRMWIFFILAFQVMIIIAWHGNGSLAVIFDEDVFETILSIFITAAILNFLRAVLDIILTMYAWDNLKSSQKLRYIMKLLVAAIWVVLMPITYCASVQNPTGVWKIFSNLEGNWQNQSVYYYCVAMYIIPNILAAFIFAIPFLRRYLESSDSRIIVILMWWAKPKSYVGRGMHEDFISLMKYTIFWIMLLTCKLAFSFYVEVLPLAQPTKVIMNTPVSSFEWHQFFPNGTQNMAVVIAIWAPIFLVYFMDTQIWYAIFSTAVGGIKGARSHLGEIRTLRMLRSRFQSLPKNFSKFLLPSLNEVTKQNGSSERELLTKFSSQWNEFIKSMREEDLIDHREREMLLIPDQSSEVPVPRWPLFLMASKIPIALDIAKDFEGKDEKDLFWKIRNDAMMYAAVIECYETLRYLLTCEPDGDGSHTEAIIPRTINHIYTKAESSIQNEMFLSKFKMKELAKLSDNLGKVLGKLLSQKEGSGFGDVAQEFKHILDVMIVDVMDDGDELKDEPDQLEMEERIKFLLRWEEEKVKRLHFLLTEKESAVNVPKNLDARRRLIFFGNSLFMEMPQAPEIRKMLSFSVLTPYFNEEVIYSKDELDKPNEDGISILFYLKKIYPDEWDNFENRMNDLKLGHDNEDELIRMWASYRGQTLCRTVRGMMYYRKAIEVQCPPDEANYNKALGDLKFTYVVSCQIFGAQKQSKEDTADHIRYKDILKLMKMYPSLRIAYIDEKEDTSNNGNSKKIYYSVLVKAEDEFDEEIYRIRLPGPPNEIGEGKPENQNHAIIFTRGEALQTIDMNQDTYFEEALKMRNVLEEFRRNDSEEDQKVRNGLRRPSILGVREYIFTGSVSSLAWFMSNQETSFVTIGQRTLANPLRVRFHYGHPDIFDKIFHLPRGGISKASKTINLSEDIFSGYNSIMRGGYVTHHEYIQVGKGRDVGMNQTSMFEAKVASGNGEQSLSRDVYRLGRCFDFFRMLSFYFTTVGFYVSSLVTVLTVYVFLYGRIYLVFSGLEREILENPTIHQTEALEALATQSVFQLGVLLVLPMFVEISIENGLRTALGHLITMHLQLAPVYFTFHLGTKAHYFGRSILHGGSKYRGTGRGFVVKHAKFAENYRMYSRSHFVKGLEIFMLLTVYAIYGNSRSSKMYWFITWSMWFLVASWLFAPYIFNPSGLEWQKTVDDWIDWEKWMGNRGGIGLSDHASWESWWVGDQEHLEKTDWRGRLLEIILALRFFIYQYGIVYHLDVAHGSRNFLVYGLSWIVVIFVFLVLKVVSIGRRKLGIDIQFTFRVLKAFVFGMFISILFVLFVVCGLTINDIFAAILAFMPTGWAIILIGQACRKWLKAGLRRSLYEGIWESLMELARIYDAIMGLIIFTPIVVLSWFPFMSEFQTRMLFNQAFSRGLQISMILAGNNNKRN